MPDIGKIQIRNMAAGQRHETDVHSSATKWVLVMDDDEIMRVVMRAMLEQAGYRIYLTDNTEETLECYREALNCGYRFDAVILDLFICGHACGKETMAKLQEIDPEVKAVVMSGTSDDPAITDFQSFGFRGALTKPFTTRDLTQMMQRVIDV